MALGQDKTTFGLSFQVRLVDRIAGSARTFWAKPSTKIKPEGTRAIAFSPAGNLLIVGKCARVGCIIGNSTSSDPQPVSWQGHTGPVSGIVFSPDNKWVFSSSSDSTDKTVRCWDLASIGPGKVPPVEILHCEHAVGSMKGDPYGKWLACAANGQIELVEQPTLKRLSTRFPLGVHHLAVAPDGRLLAASVGAGAGIPASAWCWWISNATRKCVTSRTRNCFSVKVTKVVTSIWNSARMARYWSRPVRTIKTTW